MMKLLRLVEVIVTGVMRISEWCVSWSSWDSLYPKYSHLV